jgi:hypothetical protein
MKNILWGTCVRNINFMAISEEVFEDEEEVSSVAEQTKPNDLISPSDPLEVEPMISLNSLTSFFAPQTLKLSVVPRKS